MLWRYKNLLQSSMYLTYSNRLRCFAKQRSPIGALQKCDAVAPLTTVHIRGTKVGTYECDAYICEYDAECYKLQAVVYSTFQN